MPSQRRLIVVGVFTLVAGLIAMFPARVAYHWFAPGGVEAGGISGTVWKGSAEHATAGNFYIRNLRWSMQPLKLITGKLAFSVNAPASGIAEGDVALTFGGNLRVTDLEGAFSLAALQAVIGVRGIAGNARVSIERLHVDDGLPVAADGWIEISQLLLPLVSDASIGGYRADFFTHQSGVQAAVEDTDGVVDLAGSFTIQPDRSYQFLGLLAPKSETAPAIIQQMQFLGSANERGQYELRREGRL